MTRRTSPPNSIPSTPLAWECEFCGTPVRELGIFAFDDACYAHTAGCEKTPVELRDEARRIAEGAKVAG